MIERSNEPYINFGRVRRYSYLCTIQAWPSVWLPNLPSHIIRTNMILLIMSFIPIYVSHLKESGMPRLTSSPGIAISQWPFVQGGISHPYHPLPIFLPCVIFLCNICPPLTFCVYLPTPPSTGMRAPRVQRYLSVLFPALSPKPSIVPDIL